MGSRSWFKFGSQKKNLYRKLLATRHFDKWLKKQINQLSRELKHDYIKVLEEFDFEKKIEEMKEMEIIDLYLRFVELSEQGFKSSVLHKHMNAILDKIPETLKQGLQRSRRDSTSWE